MRIVVCSIVALAGAIGGSAHAAPPTTRPRQPPADIVAPDSAAAPERTAAPTDSSAMGSSEDAVAAASEAWAKGRWLEVRRLLEPIVQDPNALAAPHLRTQALLLLADATLSNTPVPDSPADAADRRRTAAAYLHRQMDADPGWRMPPDIYTKALFDLYVDVSGERSRDAVDKCRADRMACRSDVKNEQAAYRRLAAAHEQLKADYDEQEVEVRDRVARSRLFAAIPFGAGHFYNGDIRLGAGFLSVELASGLAGISLLLYRVAGDGCRRNRGFQRGSLTCAGSNTDAITRRRKTEEVMGWVFLGTVVFDLVLAQVRFKPIETVRVRRVPRSTLSGDEDEPPRRSRRTRPNKASRPTVRPSASGGPDGASLGISLRF